MIIPQLFMCHNIKITYNISTKTKMSAKKSESIYPSIDIHKGCDEDEEETYSRRRSYYTRYSPKSDHVSPWNSTAVDTDNPKSEIREKPKYQRKCNKSLSEKKQMLFCIIFILAVAMVVLCVYYSYKTQRVKFNVSTAVEKLKQKYSKQNKSLWENVKKILYEEDSVHSFVLLYKSSAADAAECFAKDLAQMINKRYDNYEVIIYKNRSHVIDYGEELNSYLSIVKNSKHMVVLKLHEMNGEIARMFHTLCEVGHTSIKPSYFIFTLEDKSDASDPGLQTKKPYERVGKILRKAWSNLAENELHPLISRIVRNVAEISDVKVSC